MSISFDYPEAWRPAPNDRLEGTVTEITEYDGGGYGSYPILTVDTRDGQKAVHCSHGAPQRTREAGHPGWREGGDPVRRQAAVEGRLDRVRELPGEGARPRAAPVRVG